MDVVDGVMRRILYWQGPSGYCRHISAVRRAKLGRNVSVTADTVQMTSGQVFTPVRFVSKALLLLKMVNNWELRGWSKKGSAPLHD